MMGCCFKAGWQFENEDIEPIAAVSQNPLDQTSSK
jgi:hypothetical protein